MQCVKPLVIIKDGTSVSLPCGRCISCRLNYANSWSTRIVSEAKSWKYTSFVTLTYDDENLIIGEKGFATLSKLHCQNFFKEVRSKGVKFRYFLGGEYGSDDNTGRPHYHLCLFSDNVLITDSLFLKRIWKKGFVFVGTLTRNSANYVAKYCVKKLGGQEAQKYVERGIVPEFALMSRRPGIGTDYIKKFGELVKRNGFVVVDGKKQPIPKFFGARIFSDDEKAQRFSDDSQEKFNSQMTDIRQGLGYDFHIQREKQREKNIKSRLDLKRRKL